MRKVILDKFFENIKKLSDDCPHGEYYIRELNGKIIIRNNEIPEDMAILDKYSDLLTVYQDVIQRIVNNDWKYVIMKTHWSAYVSGYYCGWGISIVVPSKGVGICIQTPKLIDEAK